MSFEKAVGKDQNSSTRQSDSPTTRRKSARVKDSATEAGGGLVNHIDTISSKLAHNTLKAIAVQTESKVNEAIESGTFLAYFDGMFRNLGTGLNSSVEAEYQLLEVMNETPKALLPAQSSAVELNG